MAIQVWQIHMIHFAFAMLLFLTINWIGRHSVSMGYLQLSVFVKHDEAPAFNFILRTFSPTVYILLLSTIFYSLNWDILITDIWFIVVYYVLFRSSFNIIMGRIRLINWQVQFWQCLVSIPLSYLAYSKIIIFKVNLLPKFETISNQLWIIITLYLYSVMNNIKTSHEGTRRRKQNYLKRIFNNLKGKYGNYIKSNSLNTDIEKLAYSILIYENFARPPIIRFAENYVFSHLELTRGIMQVKSKKRITDYESIKIGIEKLNTDYNQSTIESEVEHKNFGPSNMPEKYFSKMVKMSAIRKTAAKYNRDDDYVSEVMKIFGALPDISEDLKTDIDL